MLEVIKRRRACRKFDSKPVEPEKIKEIVNAGLLAPSGMNRQTPVIIAISDKDIRDGLMKYNQQIAGDRFKNIDPFYGAPALLLVVANKEGLSIFDGAACIENMLLEATNQGLASCWIHRADEEIKLEQVRALLSFTGLDFDQYIGVGHVIIGYPDKDYKYSEKIIKEGRVFYK